MLLRLDREEAGYWSSQLGLLTPAFTSLLEAEAAAAAAAASGADEENWESEAAAVHQQQPVFQPASVPSAQSCSSESGWSSETEESGNESSQQLGDGNININYYQLPETEGFVVYVDSVASFEELVGGLANCAELGLDAEYTTTHLAARVSLLQLASAQRVFLLDMEV